MGYDIYVINQNDIIEWDTYNHEGVIIELIVIRHWPLDFIAFEYTNFTCTWYPK